VIRRRQSHRGFSLVEVLMAAGILGVGMTMVASVFPVAVDQSRQSVDTTMAALSARSVAAVMRARRRRILNWCREGHSTSGRDPRNTTTIVGYEALPDILRCYNPQQFLYPASSQREDLQRTYQPSGSESTKDVLWSMGSYVPVVFATPMNTLISSGSDVSEGPWRITIAIYKSRGRSPAEMAGSPGDDILFVPWSDSQGRGRGEPGDYIMDVKDVTSPQTNFRGEAYKVSRIYSGRRPDDPIDDSIFPVAALEDPEDNKGTAYVADRDVEVGQRGEVRDWLSLRGAIAVYHTILGD